MKKTYIYPKLNVIDMKDEICGLLTGSNGDPTDPNFENGGGTDEGGITGGDVKAQGSFGWDNEW